jgi:hypothetical protein
MGRQDSSNRNRRAAWQIAGISFMSTYAYPNGAFQDEWEASFGLFPFCVNPAGDLSEMGFD